MQRNVTSRFLRRYYMVAILGVIFITGKSDSEGVKLNDYQYTDIVRIARQIKECEGFKCKTTNECIDADKRCDGGVDCLDGSDEFNDCRELRCPSFVFTCDYGACIAFDKKCDGKKDCRDNSDETNCFQTNVTITSSNCKSDQFECKSGQCISLDGKCSGKVECDDKSDETKETCLNTYCPTYLFKCDYGACVDALGRCNGFRDCVDNSDEENCHQKSPQEPETEPPFTTPTTYTDRPYAPEPAPTSGCQLPEHPLYGKWSIVGSSRQANPKDFVLLGTILTFECIKGYKLSSESMFTFCTGKEWSTENIPTCLKKCPPLYSSKVTTIKCRDDRGIEIKCDDATDGTSATVSCAPYFEPLERRNATRYCWQGTWNRPPPACQPICGEKKVNVLPLIVNGKTVDQGNYPWVTAVYHKINESFQFVCGGSMLTQRVILTAAHCVTNSRGEVIPKEKIRIAVGKYYIKYNDNRDIEAQYSEIDQVIKPSYYKADIQRYSSDIALLITASELLLSKVIQPVCYIDLNSISLRTGLIGAVTGWGYTNATNATPSEVLHEIDVPYKSEEECYREFPQDWFDKYYTRDKICAGHYNKSIAVCRGDSGGGLVFRNNDDNRYYIHGIVSVGYTKKVNSVSVCNIQVSTLFTKVAEHYPWLDKIVSKYTTIV